MSGANAPAARSRSRRWIYGGGGLAAAAALTFALWNSVSGRPSEIDTAIELLASAVGPERTTLGRVSGPFDWAPPPDVLRGADGDDLPLPLRTAALAIENLATERTAEHLAALGKAQLVTGRHDAGIRTLEEALRLEPDHTAARIDLAAAFLEKWRSDHDAAQAVIALNHSEIALLQDPRNTAALFNKARAFQALGLDDAAVRAWRQYLDVDPSSPWAAEAREQLALLESQSEARPDTWVPEAAARDARTAPTVLYHWLERRLLEQWPASVLQGRTWNLNAELAVARALSTAGRDRRFEVLAELADTSQAWAATRRHRLAAGFGALRDFDAAFEAGRLEEAAARLRTAREHLTFTSILDPELDLRAALESHAAGRPRDESVDVVAGAAAQGYFRIAARAAQLAGIRALSNVDFGAGLRHHQAGLDLSARAGDDELMAASHTYLAAAYGEQGDRARAWTHFKGAFDDMRIMKSARRRYLVLANAALVAGDAEWDGAAHALSEELLEQTRDWEHEVGRVVGHLGRARALAALDRQAAADGAMSQAAHAAARTVDPPTRAELQAEVAASRGRLLLARNPSGAVADLTGAIDALEGRGNRFRTAGLLLVRGRAHKSQRQLADAERDWLAGIALIEDQSPSIRTEQLRISRRHEAWDLFDELILARMDRPGEALQALERGLARELLDSMAPAARVPRGVATLEWVQPPMRVMVYASLRDRLLVWTIEQGRVARLIQHPIGRAALTTLVEDHLRDIGQGADLPRSSELGRLLLDERAAAPSQVLVFVPDGPLHLLPFATLNVPGTSTPLATRTTTAVAPSLAVLRLTLQHRSSSRPDAVLIEAGAASAVERLPALPGVRAEVEGLMALYERHRAFRGGSARWKDVREALASASVVHFAGHAIAEPLHPSRSRLLLSPDDPHGPVTVGDLASAPLRPGALVVLAACATARGMVYRGEGAQSLARPFLARGAASVVASLWPVGDAASSSLLQEFHKSVRGGVHPASALADAQRALIARGTPAKVWAAFALIGMPNWRSLNEATN